MPVRDCTVRDLTIRLDLDSEAEGGETRNYELWRAGHYGTKEPDTLDWLDTHLRPGDTLWDVGANIGQYSLYAARRHRGLRVCAFEPEALSFAKLNRNIVLNDLGGAITAYPLAIADATALDSFHVKAFVTGASLHAIGRPITQGEVPFQAQHVQGTLTVSLDDLVGRFGLPVPQHVKVDVDGVEDRIVTGARDLLRQPQLRTVLIEIFRHGDIVERIDPQFRDAGFTLSNADAVDRKPETVSNYIYVR